MREALFGPRIEYGYSDDGFAIDWRTDPKPRLSHSFVRLGDRPPTRRSAAIGDDWPRSAAEYARIRREFMTPRWPDPPARRANRRPAAGVPPHADAYTLALGPNP